MKNSFFKLTIIFLFISTASIALDDENKDLNLLAPKKLNRIEGKTEPLDAIKKDEIVGDFKSPKMFKKRSQLEAIDVSKYKKVKLIDTVLETLSHSDLLKSSREKVIQYEIKLKNAFADYYPTVDAEYNLGRTRSTPSGDELERFKFFNDDNYKVVLRQNLYSGGYTFNNIKSVKKKLEVAENQYKITLDKEIKKAIKAYFGVVFANRSVMVNERNMKKLKKILEIVTIKYDNGAASIGDLTSIKANVANAMTKLVKVNSKFIESLRYYEYIVGINFEKTLPYEKDFDVNISDFEELLERTLENNRDLVNYYKSIEDEKFAQKREKSKFRPKVDFELSYKKTFDAEDLEEDETDLNGNITFSYNLFNGGRDKNKVLEVNSKIRDLNYRLSEEKKKLKWNLSKIHTSVNSVSEALKSTIEEIKASRKMISAYWDAFKLGEQDLNTLLQGQRQLNSAETELVSYEQSHVTDFFNILEITGDLSSFFDVSPNSPKFIDFTKSDYKKSIIANDGENLKIDLKTGKEKIDKEYNKEDLIKDNNENEVVKDIPLPKPSIDENITNYLEKFLQFDDESFMIEISSFGNIYESFDFIKNNNFDSNSFSYDVVKKYNIETKIAHNNFKTKDEAFNYIKALKEKKLNKSYEIKKVSEIKSLYNKYIDGLKVEVKKVKPETKIKIVEKIRQEVKKVEFKTNSQFKDKFLNSKNTDYTINISSFTDIDKVEEFVIKNDIYSESFFFKYGDNGQLIKLVFGIFENYASLEDTLNSFIIENNNIFPVVEKVSLVKKQYNDNIDLNLEKNEPIVYEYINLTKEEAKNTLIKKPKDKLEKKEELFTLSKRPLVVNLEKEKKENLQKAKIEIEKIKLEQKKQKELAVLALQKENEEKARKEAEEVKRKEELRLKKLEEKKQKELAVLALEKENEEKVRKEAEEVKRKEELRLKKLEEKKQKELEVLALEKANEEKARKEAEEVKRKEELRLKKLEEKKQKELAVLALQKANEEKVRKEAEEVKRKEELRLKKLEEKKQKELEVLALEKANEEKARKEELRLHKLEEKKQKELEVLALEKANEEKARKEAEEVKRKEELRLKKLEEKKQKELEVLALEKANEEKARKEELRLHKLEEKKQKELEVLALEKANEEKARKEAEEVKRKEELRLKKLEEKKQKELAVLALEKANEEKVRKEELRLKKLEEKKQKELAVLALQKENEEKVRKEELRLKKLEEKKQVIEEGLPLEKTNLFNNETKKEMDNLSLNKNTLKNKDIEEIDFANGLNSDKKRLEIPYAERLKLFNKKFTNAPKNKYTLRLTTIDSSKAKWYAHRFGLDPNYVVVVKNGKKSIIYYGIFDSANEAKKKTETLHPLIYESNPSIKTIGSVR